MSEQQKQSYLQTEFVFYLLPHYLVIPSFIYRYLAIMQQPPIYQIPKLPGESILIHFQPQVNPPKKVQILPASYLIKSKLSLFNGYVYIVIILLSLITSDEVLYAAKHKAFVPVYLFGFVAWQMSALLLRRQYQRRMTQSLWTHRFFWIYTAVLSITRLFQDYFLGLNMLFNIIFIPSNLILGLYGVYRPENNDTISLVHNEDIPYFVKYFFQTLQLNPYVRQIFGIKDGQAFQGEETNDENFKDMLIDAEIDINEIQRSFKPTAQNIRYEIDLLNTLPRRNIFVDRKLKYVKVNQKFKYYYLIISQIGNDRFQAQRELQQFVKLQEVLSSIFNDRNFPKLSLPRLKLSDENQQLNNSETVQAWLQNLTKTPLFMVEQVLIFLNVSQEKSAPFLTYFDFGYKSFCSRIFMVNYIKNRRNREESNNIRGSNLVGYYEQERQTTKLTDLIKAKFEFQVKIDSLIKGDKQFGFQIRCSPQGKEKIFWKIRKQEQNIRTLNQRIEQQCKVTVPFYYKILSSVTSRDSHRQEKAQAYRSYIQKLLDNQKYYCPSLFQFIRFDPITIKPSVMGTKISLADLHSQQRKSHYMEEYEQSGEFIEVTRVDRLFQDSYKFFFRRGGFRLQKTTDQIKQFKLQLQNFYKGVSSIPDLELKDCKKIQVKYKIERFLRGIETLPKVKISKYFRNFYQNSVNETD